ncbi:taurine catabolism dioxygenase TauD [Aspergillus luchuensis]|uniref:Taurine catabolism dioxygenase TauD n=1 Tax=Aspergillus kawachii TaxID=1069201 RepID=A0A146FFT7_ASPKA|nr:taurine catabolism dioxygenase TauD [Aspergillus luchuensis]
MSLFDHNLPLHLLKGDEHGIDIHMVVELLRTRFGISSRFVLPNDLRLVPNPEDKDGYRLCCVVREGESQETERLSSLIDHNGEILEEIHQVGLELHQRELRALSPEMLRQISLRCFNDMRTILLVHDKRMLGIVMQELESLVERNIITPAQAKTLNKGITETLLPGSSELDRFIEYCKGSPELKNEYILKPIRGGKGEGIVFGEDLDAADWVSRLEDLRSPILVPGTCIVQRRVNQARYDVVLNPTGGLARYPLVGTYHSIQANDLRHASHPSHITDVSNTLRQTGILKVSLQFEDDSSHYLQHLMVGLHKQHGHGLPITHSASRGWFWDIRPNSTSFQTPSHQARSETMEEFPWHTDCSYEEAPPRYFALQVLREDQCGGGTLSVMNVGRLSSLLSTSTCTALLRPEYRITVPLEFVKDDAKRHVVGGLMATDAKGLPSMVRFREDIVTPLTAEAALALQELKNCLLGQKVQAETLQLTSDCLPRGSVILMDNYRWLHARSNVRDPERHLRRVRWDARPFPTSLKANSRVQ